MMQCFGNNIRNRTDKLKLDNKDMSLKYNKIIYSFVSILISFMIFIN